MTNSMAAIEHGRSAVGESGAPNRLGRNLVMLTSSQAITWTMWTLLITGSVFWLSAMAMVRIGSR